MENSLHDRHEDAPGGRPENRNHTVTTSSSESSFNSVSPDMALEQTVKRDLETEGGIVGISGKENARDRWALPDHGGSSNKFF